MLHHCPMPRLVWLSLVLLSAWAASGTAGAQLNTMSDEYAKQIKSTKAVGALGNDLFVG